MIHGIHLVFPKLGCVSFVQSTLWLRTYGITVRQFVTNVRVVSVYATETLAERKFPVWFLGIKIRRSLWMDNPSCLEQFSNTTI